MPSESEFFLCYSLEYFGISKGHGRIRQVSLIFLQPQLCSQTHLATQQPILRGCINKWHTSAKPSSSLGWTTKRPNSSDDHSHIFNMILVSLIIAASNWCFSTSSCPFKYLYINLLYIFRISRGMNKGLKGRKQRTFIGCKVRGFINPMKSIQYMVWEVGLKKYWMGRYSK